jgi:hypothetical protein
MKNSILLEFNTFYTITEKILKIKKIIPIITMTIINIEIL